ncbi:MAG: hypothetical protein PQJ50_14030, partial [Spirochaetales bacterium]|nr:hypothetical protein [Spirochaetales bacterium]
MKILAPDFNEHFNPEILPEARGLKKENRVYNLKTEDYSLRVFVLGDQPMPFGVELHCREERFFWTCECGADKPCVHLASLILKASDEGLPESHWIHKLPSLNTSPAMEAPDPGDHLLEGDLFAFDHAPVPAKAAEQAQKPKKQQKKKPVEEGPSREEAPQDNKPAVPEAEREEVIVLDLQAESSGIEVPAAGADTPEGGA